MEARSRSAAHPNEMNFIFNLNAFSWKAMQRTANHLMPSFHCYANVISNSRGR
jgi:hypothetical protein